MSAGDLNLTRRDRHKFRPIAIDVAMLKQLGGYDRQCLYFHASSANGPNVRKNAAPDLRVGTNEPFAYAPILSNRITRQASPARAAAAPGARTISACARASVFTSEESWSGSAAASQPPAPSRASVARI